MLAAEVTGAHALQRPDLVRAGRVVVLVLGLAAGSDVLAGSALAEPPFVATCGVIRSVTPASATVAGSVVIADRSFALTARDRVNAAVVGGIACLNQTVTTNGPALELVALPSPVCGEVLAVTATALDLVIGPTLRINLGLGAGSAFTDPGRAVNACFETGLDAAGRVVALRRLGGTPSQPPATLPSTSAAGRATAPFGPIGILAIALVLWASARAAGGRVPRP
jgi:hypothetical protein